jgi:hypothetical protein
MQGMFLVRCQRDYREERERAGIKKGFYASEKLSDCIKIIILWKVI